MNPRHLHILSALGTVRTETVDGREYLVAPVIALMEGVIHAVNAPTNEFVPASVLATATHAWNGRPLVIGHPARNGAQVSANDPRILEAQGFGFIHAAGMTGKKLSLEAWSEIKKLEALGQHAMLADMRAGKPIEVSVGAFVNTDAVSGVYNGKDYKARWSSLAPDHLAFLPGGRGACSIDMGCGAMRAAGELPVVYEVDGDELRVAGDTPGHEFHGNQYTATAGEALKGADRFGCHLVKSNHSSPESALKQSDAEHRYLLRNGFDTTQESDHANLGGVGRIKTTQYEHKDGRHASVTYTHNTALGTHVVYRLVVRNPNMRNNKGESMTRAALRSAANKLLSAFFKPGERRDAAMFDTPEEAASEEAAELVGYTAIEVLLNQVSTSLDEATILTSQLIKDETKDPTDTAAQERAEEEVETARLDAIATHVMTMSAALGAINNLVFKLQQPDLPAPSDPRYAESLRTAVGARNSATDKATIQAAHDASHDMHGHAMALGAECTGMRVMAGKMKSCPTCDGMGQIGKKDCATCDGAGRIAASMKTAADTHTGGDPAEENNMKKDERDAIIRALTACPCSGFTTTDVKLLEAATDDQLVAFRTATDARKTADDARAKELTTLQAANEKAAADLKTLSERKLTPEELEAAMSPEMRAMMQRAKSADIARRTALVGALKTAGAYTEAELIAKPTDELEKLATLAKSNLPVADYSGMAVPSAPTTLSAETYAAPDPYAASIKALQTATTH